MPTPADSSTSASVRPRAFLDCATNVCDRDHLYTNLTWVEWVRDRSAAEVQVIVAALPTATNGARITVFALSSRGDGSRTDSLTLVVTAMDAELVRRDAVLRAMAQLLFPFAIHRPIGSRLSIALDSLAAPPAGSGSRDRWNAWTFSVSANAFLSGESQQSFSNSTIELTAAQTTASRRVRASTFSTYDASRFTLDSGQTFRVAQRANGLGLLGAVAISPNWSAGGRVSLTRSDFRNTRQALQATAAIEWGLYPYSDFVRRRLTLLYSAGVRRSRYADTTIFDRLSETRPLHTVDLSLGQRQRWGSANVTVFGAQLLDHGRFYRVGVFGDVALLLGSGFSISLDGRVSSIHDQIFLARQGLSNEEIVARRRALATNYQYDIYLGVRYQFGSVIDGIVNPRFEALFGSVER